MMDLVDVVDARPMEGYRLFVRFEDGIEAVVSLESHLLDFQGVFAPLRDPAEFAKGRVDEELGTVVWPSGADIAPETLYALATGRDLETGEVAEESPGYDSP